MAIMSDLILLAAALAAGFYCFVLSRRLAAFKDAESGIGQAVTSLSTQVDELSQSIEQARQAATKSNKSLFDLTNKAESVAQRLELLVASMHDIPDTPNGWPAEPKSENPVFSSRTARTAGI